MKLGHLLFSTQGRLQGGPYLAAMLSMYAGAFVLGAVIGLTLGVSSPVLGAASSAVTLAMIYPTICLNTKRLHDIGVSGWWQVAGNIFAAIVAKLLVAPLFDQGTSDLAVLGVYVAYFVILGSMPGSKGRNAFGDSSGKLIHPDAVRVFD